MARWCGYTLVLVLTLPFPLSTSFDLRKTVTPAARAAAIQRREGVTTVLQSSKIMAFAATADDKRARAYYEDTLGLRLLRDESFALVFDANGTMLRIAKVGKVTPAPYTVLGWQVGDINATLTELKNRGVVFELIRGFQQDDLGVWTAPDGTKVAWFMDPDGNMLSVTQFL